MQQGPPQLSASLQALQQYTQFQIFWVFILSWTVTESWYRHIPVFCCWGSWMFVIGQHFLLLFSLFENNNSCWGALASGRLWLHVIHMGYVCSQQRSERADKSLTWSSCPLLLEVSTGPQELWHGRSGSCSLAESLRHRFVSFQVCVCYLPWKDLFEKLPQRALQNF